MLTDYELLILLQQTAGSDGQFRVQPHLVFLLHVEIVLEVGFTVSQIAKLLRRA